MSLLSVTGESLPPFLRFYIFYLAPLNPTPVQNDNRRLENILCTSLFLAIVTLRFYRNIVSHSYFTYAPTHLHLYSHFFNAKLNSHTFVSLRFTLDNCFATVFSANAVFHRLSGLFYSRAVLHPKFSG